MNISSIKNPFAPNRIKDPQQKCPQESLRRNRGRSMSEYSAFSFRNALSRIMGIALSG